MDVQDERDVRSCKAISINGNDRFNGVSQSKNLVQTNRTSSSLKARKPYTITKQREKWTEEEHQKFLEALKLYGRGWRKIEEYVGTKTAVQIRSHAQKFFSKLERDPNASAENSIQSIVIPPPRPKRKPLHPYPRKPVDCYHGSSIVNELEWPPSPNLLLAESGNHSPASVLYRHDSDSIDSSFLEQTISSLSPSSCQTVQSMSKSHMEKDSEFMLSNSSDEGKTSWSSVPRSYPTSMENLFARKFEINSESTIFCKGMIANCQPSTSIKLFGRTLSVPKVAKSIKVDVDDVKSFSCMHIRENPLCHNEKLELLLQQCPPVQLSMGMPGTNSNSPPGRDNMKGLEYQKNMLLAMGSVAKVSHPGWTFHQGLSASNSEACEKFETQNTFT